MSNINNMENLIGALKQHKIIIDCKPLPDGKREMIARIPENKMIDEFDEFSIVNNIVLIKSEPYSTANRVQMRVFFDAQHHTSVDILRNALKMYVLEELCRTFHGFMNTVHSRLGYEVELTMDAILDECTP